MSENPKTNQAAIEVQLPKAFEELEINPQDKLAIEAFLAPLKQHDLKSYEHSVRVGLSARDIGRHLKLDEKALFFAGLLHDTGKSKIPVETLQKTEGWTDKDTEAMKSHVIYGYDALKGKFDFTAEIMLLHHTFQENNYPENLPPHLHNYSPITQDLIIENAKVLALADTYDALHRENNKFGEKRGLSNSEIKTKMLELKFFKREQIEDLYKAGIFQ